MEIFFQFKLFSFRQSQGSCFLAFFPLLIVCTGYQRFAYITMSGYPKDTSAGAGPDNGGKDPSCRVVCDSFYSTP